MYTTVCKTRRRVAKSLAQSDIRSTVEADAALSTGTTLDTRYARWYAYRVEGTRFNVEHRGRPSPARTSESFEDVTLSTDLVNDLVLTATA